MKKKFSEKQIHILDVAEKLIAKKGFEGTSVRDISTEAQINVAMISYYFGSKEKMMSYLYRYRVQKTRESFAEFAEIIKEGKPEMQMKELIKFVVNQLFKYNYFHGFVTQELRHTEHLKDDLPICSFCHSNLHKQNCTPHLAHHLFPLLNLIIFRTAPMRLTTFYFQIFRWQLLKYNPYQHFSSQDLVVCYKPTKRKMQELLSNIFS